MILEQNGEYSNNEKKIIDLADGLQVLMQVNKLSSKDALELIINDKNDLIIDSNIITLAIQEVKNRELRNEA